MTRLLPSFLAGLVASGILFSPALPAQSPGKRGADSSPEAAFTLASWNRFLGEAAKKLAPSLVRLQVWETPAGPSFPATGVVIHPGVVVTQRGAVEGKDLILGEPWGGRGYCLRLRLLGSSGRVGVLEISGPSPSSLVKPVEPGKASALPGASLALLALAGDPGEDPALFPCPLVRRRAPSGPALGEKGRRRGEEGEWILRIAGFFSFPRARGGLVCDTSLRMVGLLGGCPRVGLFPLGGRLPGGKTFSLVVPVEKVLAAVENVLKRAGAAKRPASREFTLGVVLRPDLVLDYVLFGSPAQKAGFRKGDRITQFDGVSVKTLSAFQKVFTRSKARKKEIPVLLERKGRKLLVKVRFP